MKIVKYRFNRKLGQVFLDTPESISPNGNSLKMIVLWASEPVYGQPFESMPAQNWVQLTFVDIQGNWCYAVLSDGTTNALSPWIEYRKLVEKNNRLMSVITTIQFEEIDETHRWFDYKFSGVLGAPGLADRMLNLTMAVNLPLIEPLGLTKVRLPLFN